MNKTFALVTLTLLLVPAISFAKTPNTDIPTLLKELAQLEAELAALEAPTTTPVAGAVIWPTPIATSTPLKIDPYLEYDIPSNATLDYDGGKLTGYSFNQPVMRGTLCGWSTGYDLSHKMILNGANSCGG